MTKDQWVAQMSEALQQMTGYEFLQLLGTNQDQLIEIGEFLTVQYVRSKLGETLKVEMGLAGMNPKDPKTVLKYIQDHKERYREQLRIKSPDHDQITYSFINLPGFPVFLEMLAKTENVNRSNVNAVLAVASRKTDELKQVVEEIQGYFGHETEEISLFFKRYFEEVEGWKFNKLNRREKEGKGKESTEKLMRQIAYWSIYEPEKNPMELWGDLFKRSIS